MTKGVCFIENIQKYTVSRDPCIYLVSDHIGMEKEEHTNAY